MKSVASMTGFASATRASPLGPLTVELRSVNSRFLDLSFRIPDDVRAFENHLREAITARVARGKVECRVSIARQPAAAAPRLDGAVLQQLTALAALVRAQVADARALSTAEILAWPGVVDAPGTDADAMRIVALAALDEALAGFAASRAREGVALAQALALHCDGIDAVVEQVRARTPDILAAFERRLAERLDAALAPTLAGAGALTRDEIGERIRQEVTLHGLKMDVEEETKRLSTHVLEVRRVLKAGGAVGRRLDFLMQELNREANTLGSKAAAIEMTNASVELKILIEQMREQIQNLE